MLRLPYLTCLLICSSFCCSALAQPIATSQPSASESSASESAAPKSAADENASDAKALPVVSFTMDFPESQPEHYVIAVPSDGPGHYESSGRLRSDSDESDTFAFDFPISSETRSRIFALAAQAGYFRKDLDAHRKNMAFTGNKTLRYTEAKGTYESTYNYSSNSGAEELTRLFQDLSATLEFGHRLDYDSRYQKLALNEELKRMQELARNQSIAEVAAIRPILERIAADSSVVNVARARARQLMEAPSGH